MAYIKPRHSDIIAFQNEMEAAFAIDTIGINLNEFPEAKKCLSQIKKNRKRVNRIQKLERKVLQNDREAYIYDFTSHHGRLQ